MDPTIAAAWIASGSGLLGVVVGVGGTVIVARLGFRSTRDATKATTDAGLASVRAQIAADRRNRIWERQSATYTDLIQNVVHRRSSRTGQMQMVITGGEEPSKRPEPVGWSELGAQILAYGSQAIINKLQSANEAGRRFEDAVGMWTIASMLARQNAGTGRPTSPTPADQAEVVSKARDKADELDDDLISAIRAELHAGAAQSPAPLESSSQPIPDPE